LDWIEHGLTLPPTQHRLYGIRFLQVKRPNQQYQSTEGKKATKEKRPLKSVQEKPDNGKEQDLQSVLPLKTLMSKQSRRHRKRKFNRLHSCHSFHSVRYVSCGNIRLLTYLLHGCWKSKKHKTHTKQYTLKRYT